MGALHPFDAFGDLNLRPWWDGVWIVIGRALDIDDPRQYFRVGVKDSGAAIWAEVPPAMFRGLVNFERALCHLNRVEPVHRPANHWCAGAASAVAAMT